MGQVGQRNRFTGFLHDAIIAAQPYYRLLIAISVPLKLTASGPIRAHNLS